MIKLNKIYECNGALFNAVRLVKLNNEYVIQVRLNYPSKGFPWVNTQTSNSLRYGRILLVDYFR